MIENTVEDDADAVFMQLFADMCEAVVVTEAVVYMIIIVCIIAVGGGHENRSEIYSVDVHFLEVGNEVDNLVKTVVQFAVVDPRRAAETQRIDMIEYRFVYPIH